MDQKQKEIMINFITILLIGFAVSFVLLESLNIANRLKSLFKIPLYEINTKGIKKIFDCSYCQYFWITNLISLPLCIFVLPQIPQITIIIVCINIFYAEQMNKIYG